MHISVSKSLAALLAAAIAAGAQDSTIRVSVDRVEVNATVTDKHGNPITDLEPGDFEILSDGRKQQITSCTYVPYQPLQRPPGVNPAAPVTTQAGNVRPILPADKSAIQRTIVFLVDDESFQPELFPMVKKALREVIRHDLQPGDVAAVVRSSSANGALDQFTSDKDYLLMAADHIRWQPLGRGSLAGHDIAYLASVSLERTTRAMIGVLEGMREMAGEKAVILISEDWPPAHDISVRDARWAEPTSTLIGKVIDLAVRSGVKVYTVDPTPLDSENPGADYDVSAAFRGSGARGQPTAHDATTMTNAYPVQKRQELYVNRAGLQMVADGTGGLFVAGDNDSSFALSQFLHDCEGYYQITFRPDSPDHFFPSQPHEPPPFHKITLRVHRSGAHVRYPAGYEGSDDSLRTPGTGDAVREALSSPFSQPGIRLTDGAIFGLDPANRPVIRVMLHFNAHDVSFTADEGRHQARLELICVAVDEKGNVAQSTRSQMDLELKYDKFAQAQRDGLLFQTTLPVKQPGFYELRLVLHDRDSQKLGSTREYVYVPDLKKQFALSGIDFSSGQATDADGLRMSVLRAFKPGETLDYSSQVFNGSGPVTTETRVLQNGKTVLSTPVQPTGSVIAGTLSLSSLQPGDYVLQLRATDSQNHTAAQWADFTVE